MVESIYTKTIYGWRNVLGGRKGPEEKIAKFRFFGLLLVIFWSFLSFFDERDFLFLKWPINHKNVLFFASLKQLTLALINMSALSVWYG